MLVIYDPDTGLLRETTCVYAGLEELKQSLNEAGTHYVEVEALPAPFERCYVTGGYEVLEATDMPVELEDLHMMAQGPLPSIPGLPSGAVLDPPVGTHMESGVFTVRALARGYVPKYFHVVVRTPEDEKAELVAYARQRRWELEQAGAPFGGLHLATDDRCKLLLQATVTAVDLMVRRGMVKAEEWATEWSFNDGRRRVTRSDLDDMTLVLMGYVSGLFSRCSGAEAKIKSGQVTTTEEVDELYNSSVA